MAQIGIMPDAIDAADIDETPLKNERPRDLARRLAMAKAEAVLDRHAGDFVLAADTVVAIGRRVLGKPQDRGEAKRFLSLLSGRRHAVIGGFHVVAPDGRSVSKTVVTKVRFKRLIATEISTYLDSDEWQGKAGGYAIQGLAATMVKDIQGSYPNVVGLPLFEVHAALIGLGWPGMGLTND